MKQTIKILIIVLAVLILGIIILVSVKTLGKGGETVIASTPFEKQVEQRVQAEIAGKTYAIASPGYKSIMNFIDTESSITLANGSKNISPEEVTKGRLMVFNAYAPLVINRANEIFAGSVWNDPEIKNISEETTTLLKAPAADANMLNQLNGIAATIRDYNGAMSVVSSAKNCSNLSSIASLTAKANSYNRPPLTNNAQLAASLAAVPKTARNSVLANYCAKANAVAKKATSYGSYSAFENAYNSAYSNLMAYVNAYGMNETISSALSNLSNASSRAYDYYNNSYYEYDYDDYYGY